MKMMREIVDKWENYGDESQCPRCGVEYDYERREEDEGWNGSGHWLAWRFQCNACGNEWWSTYILDAPKLEAVE